jgi:hypothetical protein
MSAIALVDDGYYFMEENTHGLGMGLSSSKDELRGV